MVWQGSKLRKALIERDNMHGGGDKDKDMDTWNVVIKGMREKAIQREEDIKELTTRNENLETTISEL